MDQKQDEFKYFIYCGSLDTMQTIANRPGGVKGLSKTLRWKTVSKTAKYQVRCDGHVDGDPEDKIGGLWCDQDLRRIAGERGLLI